jgi:hypothetical protein
MKLSRLLFVTLFITTLTAPAFTQDTPELVSVNKIWDQGDHNAFTDLIRFNDTWYCVFREASGHVKGNGCIRVIASTDGESWTSRALLQQDGIDLRDPKICLTPDNRLMITMGGSLYQDGKLLGRRPRVSLSNDGTTWFDPTPICRDGDWLWRTTWHGDAAYGVTYSGPVEEKEEWTLTLMQSKDGLDWTTLTELPVTGKPNETTLRFRPDGTMLALIRREGDSRNAWFGSSRAPYTEWQFKELDWAIGGPNFILLPDGRMVGAGRKYVPDVRMALGPLTPETYTPVLELPSGGDTSYPGLVWYDGLLWVSYYASHEGKTSIYFAKVKL